jgi:hypothetical protein
MHPAARTIESAAGDARTLGCQTQSGLSELGLGE